MPVISLSPATLKALVFAVADEIQIRAAVKAARVPAIVDAPYSDQAKELVDLTSIAVQLAALQLTD